MLSETWGIAIYILLILQVDSGHHAFWYVVKKILQIFPKVDIFVMLNIYI